MGSAQGRGWQVERSGRVAWAARSLKLPGGSWEAPDGGRVGRAWGGCVWGWSATVWSRGRGKSKCFGAGVDWARRRRTEDRAGGWWEGPQLRRRDRPGGFDGRCGGRDRLGGGRQVERAGGGRRLKLPGRGIGRLRTVPGGDGAEAIQFSRHGLEPWAGEIEMLLGRAGMGTALEDGGPGGRVAGRGRSFGAVTGLVVEGVAVAGHRFGGGRQVERAGGGRRLKLPGRGDWEAPDGAGRRWCGGHPVFAARSGAVGGGNRNAFGAGGDGHGAGGRRTGRAGGGKGPQLRRRDRPCGQGRCGRRAGSAEGGRLSGRWSVGGSSCRGGGIGRLRTVCMKELGGAEVGGTVRSRRAGEIEMLLGRVGDGHGAGGRRTGRAGGGKGPQLRRRDRPCGQGRCGPLPHFAGARGGRGRCHRGSRIGGERAAAC